MRVFPGAQLGVPCFISRSFRLVWKRRKKFIASDMTAQILIVCLRHIVRSKLTKETSQFQSSMRPYIFLDGKTNPESSLTVGRLQARESFAKATRSGEQINHRDRITSHLKLLTTPGACILAQSQCFSWNSPLNEAKDKTAFAAAFGADRKPQEETAALSWLCREAHSDPSCRSLPRAKRQDSRVP